MSPPEDAVVLCCDEKGQVQGLNRTQPGLPLKIWPSTHHDAFLQTSWHHHAICVVQCPQWPLISQCQQCHTRVRRLTFLKHIDWSTPREKTVHLISDNYAARKRPVVRQWLEKHPRFRMNFKPASASSPNTVESSCLDITIE